MGTSTITATLGGVSGNTTLTVTSAVLQEVDVTPFTATVPNGIQQQVTATGAYSDGTTQGITNLVTWSSSNTSFATINSSARASTHAQGTVTITAIPTGISCASTSTCG